MPEYIHFGIHQGGLTSATQFVKAFQLLKEDNMMSSDRRSGMDTKSKDHSPAQQHTGAVLLLFTLAIIAGACSEPPSVNAPHALLKPEYVTGAAASALQPNGRFTLPSSVIDPVGQVSAEEAKAIATRYVREVAPFLIGSWIGAHGATINPNVLAPCDRALYASTPYALMAGGLSELSLRTFGPHWVVPLCASNGQAQIVVSFSALATEVALALNSPKGVLQTARADIAAVGLPKAASPAMYSPESAASYAFTKTGKRVSNVPELVMTPMPQVPSLVRWHVVLEEPVSLRGLESATARQRVSLFVGFSDRFTSSGLLDRNPSVALAHLSWTDPVTQVRFSPVLLSTAPANLELVTRERP